MSNFLCHACICTFNSIDPKDILIGIKSSSECLCLKRECCLALDTKPFPVGLITGNDEICKLGLPCCTYALKKPSVCCSGAGHCLAFKSAQSLPFNKDYVASPICGCCFVQLYPEVGVLKQAPSANAISRV